ncbi:hypothetical protein AcW2_007015 [Taiwanofungus camphoratus]|nr:hypothetical protein AcW2_007015 [Antrodia cinnamomea]
MAQACHLETAVTVPALVHYDPMSQRRLQAKPPFSVAFRCLSIDEILREVIRHLYGTGEDRYSLVNLACTCRTFCDASLDPLWLEIGSLTQLIQTLPKEAADFLSRFDSSGGNLKDTIWEGSPQLRVPPSQFDRWMFYSSRVKHFSWSGASLPASLSLFEFSGGLTSDLYPFPCLQTLTWEDRRPIMFPCIAAFFSPVLEKIHIEGNNHVPLPCGVIETMRKRCPSLKSLVVTLGHHSNDHEIPLYDLLLKLRMQLEELAFPHCISACMLKLLLSMPRLRIAELSIDPGVRISSCCEGNQGPYLPALESLKLAVTNLDVNSLVLLMPIQSRDLSVFWLAYQERPTSLMLRQHLAIASNRRTLKHVQFDYQPVDFSDEIELIDPQESKKFIIDAGTIRPLFRLHGLRILIIHSRFLKLDDATLADIASAFPHLEELVLAPRYVTFNPDDYEVTLEGLRYLSERCPRLHSLAISLDASILPQQPIAPSSGSQSSQSVLRTLSVGSSPAGEPASVALALSLMFPLLQECRYNVTLIEPHNETEGYYFELWEARCRYSDRWEEVDRLLRSRSAVTPHETTVLNSAE